MVNYKRNQDVSFSQLDQQVVILDLPKNASEASENCYFHQLNETASFLWQCLDSPQTENELLAKLQTEFEVEPELAQQDLKNYLQQLSQQKLIVSAETL